MYLEIVVVEQWQEFGMKRDLIYQGFFVALATNQM